MTVLLLHALPLDERMWEPQRAAFPDAVAPRLYGRGASMEGWARGILEEVEGEFAVVGASMGGYCALEIARQAPQRVRALVLVGARVEADSPERREGRARLLELIRTGGAEALWENQRSRLLLESASDEAVERARKQALSRTDAELVEALEAIRDRADRTDTLAGLDAPVLVAVGEGDHFFPPAEAEALAQRARHGRFRAFAGAAHLPNLEQPDEFSAALAQFLADV